MKKKILETPDFIPDELWEEWVAYRKEDLKKPASLRSQKMQLNTIIKLRDEGYCPKKLICLAIEMEWQGIFPHERAKYGTHQKHNKLSAAERVKAKATERTNTFRLVGSDG